MSDFVHIVILIVILVVSVGLHEYAHAITSYKLWDPTPKLQNRLTPNPINHLDPYWALMMVVMVVYWWWIGWGKPVQINPTYYKKPVWWELIVAISGPLTNIFLAIIWVLVVMLYWKISGYELVQISSMMSVLFSSMESGVDLIVRFFGLFSIVNIMLAFFNLIPIPPLDWFSIVKTFLPKVARIVESYKTYIMIGFLILILLPWSNFISYFLSKVWLGFLNIIFMFFSQVFY